MSLSQPCIIFEMEQLFAAVKTRMPQAAGPRAAEGGVSVTVDSGEFNDRCCNPVQSNWPMEMVQVRVRDATI